VLFFTKLFYSLSALSQSGTFIPSSQSSSFLVSFFSSFTGGSIFLVGAFLETAFFFTGAVFTGETSTFSFFASAFSVLSCIIFSSTFHVSSFGFVSRLPLSQSGTSRFAVFSSSCLLTCFSSLLFTSSCFVIDSSFGSSGFFVSTVSCFGFSFSSFFTASKLHLSQSGTFSSATNFVSFSRSKFASAFGVSFSFSGGDEGSFVCVSTLLSPVVSTLTSTFSSFFTKSCFFSSFG